MKFINKYMSAWRILLLIEFKKKIFREIRINNIMHFNLLSQLNMVVDTLLMCIYMFVLK